MPFASVPRGRLLLPPSTLVIYPLITRFGCNGRCELTSVLAGNTSITLTEAVEWAEGDKIAIGPTDHPKYQNPADPLSWVDGSEQRTIQFIDANKKLVPINTHHLVVKLSFR